MQGSKWPVGQAFSSPWMAGQATHCTQPQALSTTRVTCALGVVRWQSVPPTPFLSGAPGIIG